MQSSPSLDNTMQLWIWPHFPGPFEILPQQTKIYNRFPIENRAFFYFTKDFQCPLPQLFPEEAHRQSNIRLGVLPHFPLNSQKAGVANGVQHL